MHEEMEDQLLVNLQVNDLVVLDSSESHHQQQPLHQDT